MKWAAKLGLGRPRRSQTFADVRRQVNTSLLHPFAAVNFNNPKFGVLRPTAH